MLLTESPQPCACLWPPPSWVPLYLLFRGTAKTDINYQCSKSHCCYTRGSVFIQHSKASRVPFTPKSKQSQVASLEEKFWGLHWFTQPVLAIWPYVDSFPEVHFFPHRTFKALLAHHLLGIFFPSHTEFITPHLVLALNAAHILMMAVPHRLSGTDLPLFIRPPHDLPDS